jgi:hypothetical protein
MRTLPPPLVGTRLARFDGVRVLTRRRSYRPLGMRARLAFRDPILLAFVVVQLFDAMFTYVGVKTFGSHIEGNPIVAWYIAAFGLTAGLLTMKGMAVACAAILHLLERHITVAVLTVIYLVVALWPWADLLAATRF